MDLAADGLYTEVFSLRKWQWGYVQRWLLVNRSQIHRQSQMFKAMDVPSTVFQIQQDRCQALLGSKTQLQQLVVTTQNNLSGHRKGQFLLQVINRYFPVASAEMKILVIGV